MEHKERMENPLNIILSPHHDDAVLSLGGLLAKNRNRALVATLFAGKPANPVTTKWDQKCGFENSDEAMDARTVENIKALRFLGLTGEHIRDYPYPLKSYRRNQGKDEADNKHLVEVLTNDIAQLLSESTEEAAALYAPALDHHIDHKLTRDVLLALRRIPHIQRNCSFFLYQDLPYAYHLYTEEGASDFKENLRVRLESTLGEHLLIKEIRLDNELIGRKKEAVYFYQSQYRKLSDDLDALLTSFAELQCPPEGCEIVYELA